MEQNQFLNCLKNILGHQGGSLIFPCIRDLVANGLQMSRLSPADPVPNRQDLTQYLAAWCRLAGLDEDTCRKWLSEYAVAMLSAISRSSVSAIRHSTKSNVRYIYRREVAFVCGRAANQFKAQCNDACPVYAKMENTPRKTQRDTLTALKDATPRNGATLPAAAPLKQFYQKQFEAAIQLVRHELKNGAKSTAILNLLNQQELKTRTGRKWTYPILCTEIRKLTAQL